jgi:endoglucanase
MLEAHADEIGFMVRYISEQGFVYVSKLGGSDPSIARGKRVFIHTRNGIVSGIFGNTGIHLQDKSSTKKIGFPRFVH